MSFAGLLNQTITIYEKSAYSADGRTVPGATTEIQARVQETGKRRMLPTGSLITIDIIVFVPPDTSINTDDRVGYGGNNYKVFSKYSAVDGTGRVHHYKLELIKWQIT